MPTLTLKGLDNSEISLQKINQDAYSGEYFKRISNTEYRVKVRHTNESPKNGAAAVARHNVDVQCTVYSTDSTVPPQTIQAYIVLRHPLASTDQQVKNIASNLQKFVEENDLNRLIWWETDLVSTEA